MRPHERFQWTFSKKHPTDSREGKYDAIEAARLNSYKVLAIVDKRPGTAIENLRDWEKDATYKIVMPLRSGRGFQITGPTLSSPKSQNVSIPSDEEQLAVINEGKLIGSLAGGHIFKLPFTERLTGAIPVMDSEVPGEMFHYLPALVPPLAMNRQYFELEPSYIAMKEGEMPSYVFWKRRAEFPPSYKTEQARDPTQDPRTLRSQAPTPEPRPVPPTVNTGKATAAKEQVEPVWEVFDPRLEEDPIEFLDFYNVCLKGRHGIRSRLMLREADIDRVNYISPCLAHNHKETAVDTPEETAMDTESVRLVPPPTHPGVTASQLPNAAAPKPWVQPGPIAGDDPYWAKLRNGQDRATIIRKARIRPKPVFTHEYCNTPGARPDPKKADLTREMYDRYYSRAITAQCELEKRSKCCHACGLIWTKCTTTRHEHYNEHRKELKLYLQHCKNENRSIEPEMRVDNLDPARGSFAKNIPDINWFRDLEKIILNMENELLEREQTCHICDKHVDFIDGSMADHYNEHALERKQLRAIGAVVGPSTPTAIVTPNGASLITTLEDSPPARTHHGFQANALFMHRHEQATTAHREELTKKLADKMIDTAKELRATGTIQPSLASPIPISSGSKSSEPVVVSSSDVMDLTEDGPIHSDVVGNTTARIAFPGWQKPTSKPPADNEDEIDFISQYDGQEVPSKTLVLVDALQQLDGYCKAADIPRRAVDEAKRMFRAAFDSGVFKDRDNTALSTLSLGCIALSCRRHSTPRTLSELAQAGGHTNREVGIAFKMVEKMFAGVSLASPVRQEIVISSDDDDDDDDLYSAPQGDPVQEESDYDPAKIISAIRDRTGELHALNDSEVDDSEEVEEVPEDFGVDASDEPKDPDAGEDPEILDIGFDADQLIDAVTHDLDMNVEQSLRARIPANHLVERAHQLPPGQLKTHGPLVMQTSRDAVREYAIGELSPVASQHDTEYAIEENAGEEGVIEEDPVEENVVEDDAIHEDAMEGDSVEEEAPRQYDDELDVATLLAHATAHGHLRKMNLTLQEALYAIGVTNVLIENAREAHDEIGTNGLVDEQSIEALRARIYRHHKHHHREKHDDFSFDDVYLNTTDLLHGIRLELYDIWRIITKARNAYHEMAYALGKEDRRSLWKKLPRIQKEVAQLTRSALLNTWRHGYTDEPFPVPPRIPVRYDGLDFKRKDLEIGQRLMEAWDWGCGPNNLKILSDKAWKICVDMVKDQRASPGNEDPQDARHRIKNAVKAFVECEIEKEKRWRRETNQQLDVRERQEHWSTEAVRSQAPSISPSKSPAPVIEISSTSEASSSGSNSQGSNKRKRPAPLPTPVSNRKRKSSDGSFEPGPPTPFNPDEVSPRIPKMPRKSSDPLYRPGSALLDPTTPPATPKPRKRSSSSQKAADRTAKKAEKRKRKRQALKAEKKGKGKKVTFDTAPSSKSSSSASSSSSSFSSSKPSTSSCESSKSSSPQVIITKKSGKKASTIPATKKVTKASMVAAKNSSGVTKKKKKKTPAKSTKTATGSSKIASTGEKDVVKVEPSVARPKRQAAIEAEKNFGKTRFIG